MSSLKHFCLAVFHLLTFLILVHLNKLMVFNIEYTELQLFLVALITISNFGLTIFHASRIFISPAQTSYEDFVP